MTSEIKEKFLNVPNAVSMARIAMAPVLIVMLLGEPGQLMSFVAAVIFLAVALTDWLDGYLARRLNVVTTLGKFLDPVSDKIVILTALVMLVPLDRVPAWMVALILAREIAVTGLRAIAVEQGVVIAASWQGKTKVVMQFTAVVPLIVHYKHYWLDFHLVGTVFIWVAFVFTIYSGVDYFIKFFTGSLNKE
jgi:CDP-diacylglycerol--glycerol-3-phosphate 3-phosphatidyltransferase